MTANPNTSNDSRSNTSSNIQGADFNMKHRLTGAGLIISFGVILLPWLLGSYSISADGDAIIQNNLAQKVDENNSKPADTSIPINDGEEIKVFVSKIKPVDSKGRQIYEAQKSEAKKTDVTNTAKDTAKPGAATSVEKVKETLKSSLDKKIGTEKTKKVASEVKEKVKAKEVAKVSTVTTPKTTAPKKVAAKTNDVEQGYIVSVGVYLKRDGAQRVIDDLQKKGFKPSSSESKSSKGLATRVWLGPFSTRAAAGKERSKLEQIIGEKGWIIRYP